MSVFGSREEDPLLQDDPLAPSSDGDSSKETSSEEEPSEEISSDETPPSTRVPSNGERTSSGASEAGMGEEDRAVPESEGADSVFRARVPDEDADEDGHFRFDGDEETRTVVRSEAKASDGRLTAINAAFEEGWRLERVELRENERDDPPSNGEDVSEDASTGPSSTELAFVLRRPTRE